MTVRDFNFCFYLRAYNYIHVCSLSFQIIAKQMMSLEMVCIRVYRLYIQLVIIQYEMCYNVNNLRYSCLVKCISLISAYPLLSTGLHPVTLNEAHTKCTLVVGSLALISFMWRLSALNNKSIVCCSLFCMFPFVYTG